MDILVDHVADDAHWPRINSFFAAAEPGVYCLDQLLEDVECEMPDELSNTQRKCRLHKEDPEKT
ncbi:hypothetical protein QIS74_11193 [Colletotrichum tabaci]|uniref:Uncharacterized protein n=1 Tax=Colletotrichum tabaci TaxID=1209068 RepID=A0AAV9SYG4_9PEZI